MLFQYDFYYFYAIGRILISGGNIYDHSTLAAEMWSLGFDRGETPFGNPYPPWTLYLYAPLAYLPFQTAQVVWGALSALALLAAVLLFTRFTQYGRAVVVDLSNSQYFVLVLLFFPFFKLLFFGQTVFIGLLGLCLYLAARDRKQNLLGGVALSLLILKVHLAAPLLAASLIGAAVSWNFRLILGFALGSLVQISFPLIYDQGVYLRFTEYLPSFYGASESLRYPALGQILFLLTGGHVWRYVPMALALVYAARVGAKGEISDREYLRKLLPLTLLSVPYCWSHDFVLLFPSYLAVTAAMLRVVEERTVVIVLSGLFFLSCALLLRPGLEMFMVWMPLAVFIANCSVLRGSSDR